MEHPRRKPNSRTATMPRRTPKRAPGKGGVDNPRVPAVEFPPAVADWVQFLAALLIQEALREFRERNRPA
jgi:hypothetical protein